jgi:hypothetical protein
MSFNGRDIPWWVVASVAVGLILVLITAYYA